MYSWTKPCSTRLYACDELSESFVSFGEADLFHVKVFSFPSENIDADTQNHQSYPSNIRLSAAMNH